MLPLPHAVTNGASLYIKQETWSRVSMSRLDLISILALSLVFHAITLEQSGLNKTPQIFGPLLPTEYVTVFLGWIDAPEVRCGLTDTQTQLQ